MDYVKEYFDECFEKSDDVYSQFLNYSDELYLPKKQYFIEEGSKCIFLGIVKKGILRSYILRDGEECISDFYLPGSVVVSYRSFLTGEKSSGYIQALENSTIQIISKSDFDALMETSHYGYKWGKYLSDTLFIKKCKKETSLLVDSAIERYQLLLETYPNIEQKVSQRLIASYLGIKPESLSRIKRLNLS